MEPGASCADRGHPTAAPGPSWQLAAVSPRWDCPGACMLLATPQVVQVSRTGQRGRSHSLCKCGELGHGRVHPTERDAADVAVPEIADPVWRAMAAVRQLRHPQPALCWDGRSPRHSAACVVTALQGCSAFL